MIRIRTGYSFRQAAGGLGDVLARLKECGYPAAPITDRGSTFGWGKWSKAATKAGLRPVFGVELGVTESYSAKKPNVDYWTFLAKDHVAPLNRLVNLATQQFRYEPLITYHQAQALETDGLIRIVGNRARLDLVLNDADTYIGLSPSVSRGYLNEARKTGIPFVACSDNKFVRPDDQGFYEVLVGRNANTQTYDQHIQTMDEWQASVRRVGARDSEVEQALSLAPQLLTQASAQLEPANLVRPTRPATLRAMCEAGARKIGCDLSRPEYAARLDYELRMIADKSFEDYFYLVADICTFARANMIVGPARGSSCGSLVCYLLEITTIDPIPYGLIFERFIDVNRDDLPDIDIDFSDQNRYMVFDYLVNKFGREHVGRLGTVAMFQPRSALEEVGTALRVPKWKCDAVAESLIERSSGDSRALQTLGDTMRQLPAGRELLNEYPEMEIAARMEGHPRHYGQHAAGVVISERPIMDHVAVDHRTGATMCDKRDAEDLNLLKIDALGLTQLSVIEDALRMAGLPANHLETIPLDDREAIDVINKRMFAGIFQFNGIALQSLTKQFKLTEFNDLVSVTALARPGPLASGGASEWVLRRNGEVPIIYPHPIFKPHLEDTMGIVIYQEQVMQIGREVGGLTWGDVTALRKAMSKSLGAEFFDQYGDRWKVGAIEKGVDPKVADKVWDDLCAYGSWSFNKSHSVAYGLISYWCCWLKAHYPLEFAAGTLTHMDSVDRQILLLREMRDEGFGYVPVDADISTDKWTVGLKGGKKFLVGPLSNVVGLGPKMVNTIIGARARGEALPDKIAKLMANPRTPLDSLYPVRDAIRRHMPDPGARNIHTPPTDIIDIDIRTYNYTALIFCVVDKINPRDENEAVKIAQRGFEIKDGQTASLNLYCRDDTDMIFCKVDRRKYQELGKPIVDRGRPGKSLYAIKGTVLGNRTFRMMMVEAVRYIGDLAGDAP